MGTLLPLSRHATSFLLHISELTVLVFGALLVVGLIGEEAKSAIWQARKRWFVIMIIVGVAGELLGDGGIFVFSERLQRIDEHHIADLAGC
jgi:hypothetical protein